MGAGLYDVDKTSGADLTMGLVNDQLLLGKATPVQIRAFAAAPSTSVPGAAGALAFRIGLLDLLHPALKHAPSPAAPRATWRCDGIGFRHGERARRRRQTRAQIAPALIRKESTTVADPSVTAV